MPKIDSSKIKLKFDLIDLKDSTTQDFTMMSCSQRYEKSNFDNFLEILMNVSFLIKWLY